MVAGGALDSQNRPSPVGQRPTDNPKDCRLCRNVDQATFFLIYKARRKNGVCGCIYPLTSRRLLPPKPFLHKILPHGREDIQQRSGLQAQGAVGDIGGEGQGIAGADLHALAVHVEAEEICVNADLSSWLRKRNASK